MAIPNNFIDKITKDGDSRIISPSADNVRVDNENFDGADLDEVLDEVAQAIEDAGSGDGTVTGVKIGSTTYEPTDGVVDLSSPMNNKVDKVTGKMLSTNDYTNAEKTKLAGIAEGATANQGTVTGIKVNDGNVQEPTNGVVNLQIEAGAQGQKGDKGDTVVVGGEQEFTIVNDTTTGGASDALSAEMGKRVAGREATDRARIDAIVEILKKSVFVDDQSTAIAALDALANATDSISIDKTSYLFNGIGGTMTLTAYTDPASKPVTWSSSDTSVATVSDGVVTAVAEGTAVITAMSGDKSVTCAITVQSFQVDSVTLNQNTLTSSGEVVGATHQLTATTSPSGGSVVWSSSDTSVATVDQTGLVTVVGNGSCTITATSGTVSASCAVSVSGIVHQYRINVGTLTNVTLTDGSDNAVTNGQTVNDGTSLTLKLTPASSHEITSASVMMGGVAQTLTDNQDGSKSVALTVSGDIMVSASASFVRMDLLASAPAADGMWVNSQGKYTTQSGAYDCKGRLVSVDLGKRYLLKVGSRKRLCWALMRYDSDNSQYVMLNYGTDMPQEDVAAYTNTNYGLSGSTGAQYFYNNPSSKKYFNGYIDFKTPQTINEGIGQLYLYIGTFEDPDSDLLNEMRLYEWSFTAVDAFHTDSDYERESHVMVAVSVSSGALSSGASIVIKLTPGAAYHFENYNLGQAASFACMGLCKTKDGGYTFERLGTISGYVLIRSNDEANKATRTGNTYAAYMNTTSTQNQAYGLSYGDITAPTAAQINDEGAELCLLVTEGYIANGTGDDVDKTFTLTQITTE